MFEAKELFSLTTENASIKQTNLKII